MTRGTEYSWVRAQQRRHLADMGLMTYQAIHLIEWLMWVIGLLLVLAVAYAVVLA